MGTEASVGWVQEKEVLQESNKTLTSSSRKRKAASPVKPPAKRAAPASARARAGATNSAAKSAVPADAPVGKIVPFAHYIIACMTTHALVCTISIHLGSDTSVEPYWTEARRVVSGYPSFKQHQKLVHQSAPDERSWFQYATQLSLITSKCRQLRRIGKV